MSKVILLIDGEEVYTNSISSSTSTTPDVKYTIVVNPTIGNNYYYIAKYDENHKPIYKESKLTNIRFQKDGIQSSTPFYMFDDGHESQSAIYKRSDSGGGKSRRRKLRKSRKKRRSSRKKF